MVKVGDIVKGYRVTKVATFCYIVIDSRLTNFIGYEIETLIKKRDFERMVGD